MIRRRRMLARLWNFFHRRRAEAELAREVNAHLVLLADDFERRGMSPGEARVAMAEWNRRNRLIATSVRRYGLNIFGRTFATPDAHWLTAPDSRSLRSRRLGWKCAGVTGTGRHPESWERSVCTKVPRLVTSCSAILNRE